jgi:hypothetical protein
MAIIKLMSPIADMRGTVGGSTYSRNKSGNYVKRWSQGPKNHHPMQQANRANLSSLPTQWRNLTQAQRDDWDTFAADPAQALTNSMGETYYITGFQWFSKCNNRLLACDESLNLTYPTAGYPTAPSVSEVRITPSGSESDLCTGGNATASSSYSGATTADKAFDDSPSTFWASAATSPPCWLSYLMLSAKRVLFYTVTSRDTSTSQTPTAWVFQGLNGAVWETVHAVTDQRAWTFPETRYYFPPYFASTYAQYRLYITQNEGAAITSIAEVQFFYGLENASCLTFPQAAFDGYLCAADIALMRSTVQLQAYSNFRAVVRQEAPYMGVYIQEALENYFGTIQLNRGWHIDCRRFSTEGLASPADTFVQTTFE